MREIKFRAKRVDNGEWVYGNYCQSMSSPNAIQELDYYGNCEGKLFEIDRNTLCQYTGLEDKNGKEVYEGDIVKTKYIEKRDFQGVKYNNEMEFVELVIFKDQAFQLEINNDGIKMYRYLNLGKDARTYGDIKLREIEVIGNIYDNPELLKGE